MILLIDNYDSFSYNLYQIIGSLQPDIRVLRNDAVSVDEIRSMQPTHIILSPGPGRPENAGVCEDVVEHLAGLFPILGICLGHQAIFHRYGGSIVHARQLMHGKQSEISIDNDCPLFAGLGSKLQAARYHSLIADMDTLPRGLKIIARTDDGEIMGVADEQKQVYGLQFHPESILTPKGCTIIKNFLSLF